MEAFNNDPKLKADLLEDIRFYSRYGCFSDAEFLRGGAMECILVSLNRATKRNLPLDDPDRFEAELGIPSGLAYVIEVIFDGLPEEEAKLWPEQFIAAVAVGADLSGVVIVCDSAAVAFLEEGVPDFHSKMSAKLIELVEAVQVSE